MKKSNSSHNRKEKELRKPVKILLITAGTILIVISIFGIFIPVLPTTPFLLLSAALFAKSSQRFYDWLVNNRILGRYIKNYREGKGIPLKAKIVAITLLWITIGYTTIFAIDILWLRIILSIIAIGVTIHIARIRPKDKNKIQEDS